jgi:hypothetical protein
MSDDVEFGPAVAETTVTDDHPMGIDPRLYTDDGGEPAAVWASSQRLREVVDRQEARPPAADRQLLATEAQRQLVTLGLYREITRQYLEPPGPGRTVSLYVIIFPGQARDNTGLKDLNDKVLGYGFTLEYIAARQEEIRAIFPPPDGTSGPRYVTVGQDYKTASIVAVGKPPEEFAKALLRLDDRLRERLLEFLTKAEKDADAARLKEIRKLRSTLETSKKKREHYWFDIVYGTNTLSVRGQAIDITFQLLTEALKGAGMARFAAKGQNVKTQKAKRFAKGRGVDRPAKGHDPRGRMFQVDTFRKILTTAGDLKQLMTQPYDPSQGEYRYILVDKVWTTCFLLHNRVYFGNPDVIHEVRKHLLQPPTIEEGFKYNYTEHKELLELWLVTVNTLDFVKEFASGEYPSVVNTYHVQALLILEQLLDPAAAIDWHRLTRFLTQDIRQRFPLPISRTASEFQFYSYASDRPDQLFFVMDVRGLGAKLMAHYEAAQMTIVDEKLTGMDLMRETLQSTDVVVERRRVTYERVVAVFRKHYPKAAEAGSRAEAMKAFGGAMQTNGAMPNFPQSLQVMLGGDEVFVAAHPYYARCEHLIIADLARELLQDRPLNLRTGVAYSTAVRVPGAARSGHGVSDPQRRENQKAHDRAFKLAADSLTMVKPLERTHRRIERLIELLEVNEKKKDQTPPYRKKLHDLRLLEVYARVKRGHAKAVSAELYARLHQALIAGNLGAARATGLFELVDFAGGRVDAFRLDKEAHMLEAAVRRDVGRGNYYAAPIPVPGWLKKIIDLLPKVA